MGQRHVAIVEALIERWNRGEHDAAAIGNHVDPAVELESPLSSLAGEPYRGYEGVEGWIQDLDEQFAEWVIGLDRIRTSRHQVIVVVTVNATGRASGAPVAFPARAEFDFGNDGLINRVRIGLDVGEE